MESPEDYNSVISFSVIPSFWNTIVADGYQKNGYFHGYRDGLDDFKSFAFPGATAIDSVIEPGSCAGREYGNDLEDEFGEGPVLG